MQTESLYPYANEFWQAKEILYSVSDCRGLKIEGIEQDEDSVAEIDSVDALLEFLGGLEWEYNVAAIDAEGDVDRYIWSNWLSKESADAYRDKVIGEKKVTHRKIVRRVKAGKVEYVVA